MKNVKKMYPKSWKDLKKVKGYYVSTNSYIVPYKNKTCKDCKNIITKKKYAKSILVLPQLIQLRDRYWKISNWKPDWSTISSAGNDPKYCIIFYNDTIEIKKYYYIPHTFSFKTREIAEHFLKYHYSLLKTWFEIKKY